MTESQALTSIQLIVGLCNPGADYAATRHNAGGWFAQALATSHHLEFVKDNSLNAFRADIMDVSLPCKILMPLTFMNLSGRVVAQAARYYRIPPERILVAHDDLDLDVGIVKLKTGGGGHGGHNGLRDIITHLGTPDFQRLRLGIGHPGHRHLVHDYVLSKPSVADKEKILQAISHAVDAWPLIAKGDLQKAQTQINTFRP